MGELKGPGPWLGDLLCLAGLAVAVRPGGPFLTYLPFITQD